MITAEQIRDWAARLAAGVETFEQIVPEWMLEWTHGALDAFKKILDWVNVHANKLETAAQLLDTIVAYLNARKIFGSTGEASVELPAECADIRVECEVVREALQAA